jgi:hypothetical protein
MMFPDSLPFLPHQQIIIPAGTMFMKDGMMFTTDTDTTVAVLKVLHGYLAVEAGSLVSHPPIILGVKNRETSSYEVTADLLERNNITTVNRGLLPTAVRREATAW